MAWLADQVWPDSKALGKAPGLQARRSVAGHRLGPKSHAWVWSGSSWRCRLCGRVSLGGVGVVSRAGAVLKAKVHRRHVVRDGWLGSADGPPFPACMRCGCARMGGNGLQDPRSEGHQAALRRLSFLPKGLHPYSRHPVVLGQAGGRNWSTRWLGAGRVWSWEGI